MVQMTSYLCQIIILLVFVIELSLAHLLCLIILLGCAIDINPLYNPYVSKKNISPVSGTIYANRNSNFEHQIQKNDVIYNIFKSKGWSWGGNWANPKDYQHFEKNI